MLHPIRKHTPRVGQLKLKHSSAMMIWHLLIDKVLRYNVQSYSMFLCQTSKRFWDLNEASRVGGTAPELAVTVLG